ncbi:MAG: diguanylate cyclase [Armatimonadota bacterium]
MPSGRDDLAERLWPDKLQELQDALSRSFAVPVMVVEPSGRPLTACEDLSQFCRRLTRRVPITRPCLDCGRAEPGDDPPSVVYDPVRRRSALHHCPLGLVDIASPVYAAGEVIGYVLSPQVVVGEPGEARLNSVQPRAQGDECAALVASAARIAPAELARVEAGVVATSWLLGAVASARRRNLRLVERLREQCRWMQQHAVTDAVTGLANRRRFMETLASEVRRARRYKRSISLAVLEVESFREVNDEFGHEMGDAVLQSVAHCIGSTLRQTDVVGRVSGAGFAVLLPETDESQALVAINRVASAVDDLNASGDLPVEVKLAVGIVDSVLEPGAMLQAAWEAASLGRAAGSPGICPL